MLRHIDIKAYYIFTCILAQHGLCFFVDMKCCFDYNRITKLLKYHHAHVATFLSKDVTHIIRNEKAIAVNSDKDFNKMKCTRAESIVRLSLRAKMVIENKNTITKEPATIFTPDFLTKFSDQCNFDHCRSPRVVKANAKKAAVRALRGQYIKVEDEQGIYRPLLIEMKAWPVLYFDGHAPLSPFCNPEAITTHANRFPRVEQQFCELCNAYFLIKNIT